MSNLKKDCMVFLSLSLLLFTSIFPLRQLINTSQEKLRTIYTQVEIDFHLLLEAL